MSAAAAAPSRDPVPGRNAIVVGPSRSGASLLYRLLCLHPDVAYVSSLERRFHWLPASATGRVRLRRYSTRIRHWFHENAWEDGNHPSARTLLRSVVPVPVDVDALCRQRRWPLSLAGGDGAATLNAGVNGRLRARIEQLKRAAGARVLVAKLGNGGRRLPMIGELFPRARYLSIERDGRDVASSLAGVDGWSDRALWWDPKGRTPAEAIAEGEELLELCARNWAAETNEISRCLAQVPASRVLRVRFEDLIAMPVEQMGQVLDFLGLVRRRDYEWALKALRFPPGRCVPRSTAENAVPGSMIADQSRQLNRSELAP